MNCEGGIYRIGRRSGLQALGVEELSEDCTGKLPRYFFRQ